MSHPIIVYGFETSNNMKVRVALGYKGIPYTFHSVDPGERADIVRISGQHLTPVLVHGEQVTFDSAAILRYLDVRFPSTPKLFGASVQEQWAIEDWELYGRKNLADPMMSIVHTKISGGEVSDELKRSCQDEFNRAVDHIAQALEGREWLVGDEMTAADITIGAVLHRIKVASLFDFPESSGDLEDYAGRVMAFDGVGRE